MRITSGITAGQVLQRLADQTARAIVRGETEANGPVHAELRDARGGAVKGWARKEVGVAAKGTFTASLAGVPVGGPYTLTLHMGDKHLAVSEIFVGDVWLLAGQSNMEGIGNLADAPKSHPMVRAMYMDDHWGVAQDPLHVLMESPDPAHTARQFTPEERANHRRTASKGAGVGVPFGREMVRRSSVPQGLLCTAHGGTSMAQWDPRLRKLGGKSLYGSMFRTWSLTEQPVSGVLWYQGESDAAPIESPVYTKRMEELVAALRKDLKQPRLPVVLVQIGRNVNADEAPWWNDIQEQQRLLPTVIPGTAVVSALDLELDDGIHISTLGYQRLASRLARAADRIAHNTKEEVALPQPLHAKRAEPSATTPAHLAGRVLEVTFSNVVGGLRATGRPTGFALVDSNRREVKGIYKITLVGDVARLELETDRTDLQLMYGLGRDPYVNLTDSRDEALPAFGPLRISGLGHVSTFVSTWQVTKVQAPKPIADLKHPELSDALGWKRRTWADGFINRHSEWEQAQGWAAATAEIEVSEAMRLELRVGYDGPTRVWFDGKPVVSDLAGINPCVPDKSRVELPKVKAGRHRVTVVMDLNGGLAWGFFLRFARLGLTDKQLEKEDFALPKAVV